MSSADEETRTPASMESVRFGAILSTNNPNTQVFARWCKTCKYIAEEKAELQHQKKKKKKLSVPMLQNRWFSHKDR